MKIDRVVQTRLSSLGKSKIIFTSSKFTSKTKDGDNGTGGSSGQILNSIWAKMMMVIPICIKEVVKGHK